MKPSPNLIRMKNRENKPAIFVEETVIFNKDGVTKVATPKSKKSKALNKDEKARLLRCEATIMDGKKAYMEVGEALEKIHRDKLYREEFSSFGEYCIEKWGFTKQHAHRLIGAYKIVEPIGDSLKPENEAQVRELSKVSPEKRSEVIQCAKAIAGEDDITAKDVKEAVEKICGKTKKAEKPANVIEMPSQDSPVELTPLREVIGWVIEVHENLLHNKDRDLSLKLLSQVIDELEARITNEGSRKAA